MKEIKSTLIIKWDAIVHTANFKSLKQAMEGVNLKFSRAFVSRNIISNDYIHTYIHNWLLQPFSQNYDPVSHTTYVVCVNFLHTWRDLQFKVDSEWQIFEKLFMAILFTLRAFARNLLRGSRRRNISFLFRFDIWPGIIWLWDYGDYMILWYS